MSKRKLRQGAMITSLDQLARCDWVFVRGKPYNRGWVLSWQLNMAKRYVDHCIAFEGVRLTNGQYYLKITDSQIKERFSDELRRISPCEKCGIHGECQEPYCYKAILAWKEAEVK
jgi:hypothetical protein